MGTSVGAGRATRGWLWPQPNRSDRVPTGTNQVRASDHGRPLKTQPGKIVQRSNNTAIGRDLVGALAGYGLPILPVQLSQRVLNAESAARGLLVIEVSPDSAAAREMSELVSAVCGGCGLQAAA